MKINIQQKSLSHRLIAMAILLTIFCLFAWVIISIFSQKEEMQQRFENAQLQLEKYKILAESLPQLKTVNAQLSARQNTDRRYLNAGNISLAAAKLQKKVQLLIEQSAARLISMQVVKTQTDGGFQPVTLKLQTRLTHMQLRNLLFQLENSEPVGFVYNLHIQQQRNYQASADTLLDVRMEYTAFMVTANER